jgi:uncharacterized protein
MKNDYDARHLNIDSFTQSHGSLTGQCQLIDLKRFVAEAQGPIDDAVMRYVAEGSLRVDAAAGEQVWLSLNAEAALPMVCQRCLGPVNVPLQVSREFRFVATEEMAEIEDEEAEEDVLVSSRDFNLIELVEDELLMALPVVPKHVVCPSNVQLQAVDPDFEQSLPEKPNPFAVLKQLKSKP